MNEKSWNLKRVGQLLKERRAERNLSLKEVENATSIRVAYLQAIEEGEMKNGISPVYAQGFAKQYALFLDVEIEEILRDHPDLFKQKQRDQEFSYGIGTLEMRGHPGGNVKWIPNALLIGGLTLLLVAAWYFARMLEVI